MTAPHIFKSETGQTMTEYSVVLGLIVIVTLVAFTQLGDAVDHALVLVKALLP